MARSLLAATTVVAVTAAIGATTAAAAAISQVHLGLSTANDNCANGISVSFASDVATPFAVTATSAGATSKSAKSSAITYSVDEPEYKYSYTSPSLHTALLCDLAGNQKYAYSIGSDYSSSFVTPPHAGADDVETIIGVVGDPGDTTYSETTLSELGKPFEGKTVQAIFVAGDYSYANGEQRQWDNWFDEQMNLTSYIPFTGINGNHETITNAGHLNVAPFPADRTLRAENYLGYLSRVYTPITPAARAARKTWYSLDVGLIHAVFLDDYTGSNGTDTSVVGTARWLSYREEQLAWLKTDLANVDRAVTPWVIVFKHNPYYNTWSNHQCQCSSTIFEIDGSDAVNCWNGVYKSGTPHNEPHCGLQAKLEDVYVQYKVNMVMAGHVHAYERTNKIYKNKVDTAKGVYYVTTGGAGNYEGHAGPRLNSSRTPSWSLAANNVTFGGSRVIATRKSLRTVWFANEFLNKNEAVASDGFTVNADGNDVITWPATPVTPTTAPVTQAPVTQAPVTPTTAPVTQAPATKAPITPTTAPVTQTPATKAPITPTTAPVTQTPVTQTPATQAPVTPAPTTPSATRASC